MSDGECLQGFSNSMPFDLARGFVWRSAGLLIRQAGGGVRVMERGSGILVAFHPGVEGHAWLSPRGDLLVAGWWGRVDALDPGGALRWTFRPKLGHVESVAFRDSRILVTSSWDDGQRAQEVLHQVT